MAALMGVFVLGAFSVRFWLVSRRVQGGLAPIGAADFVACTDDEAWLRELREGSGSAAEPSRTPLQSDLFRSTLIRVGPNGTRGTVNLGQGVIAGASLIPGRTGRAVLLRETTLPEAKSILLRGSLDESQWRREASPLGIVGVAFDDDLRGFVWSRREVFATEDGGASWKAISLGPTVIARGTDSRHPRLDKNAVLWVPTSWDGDRPGGSLWRAALDGSATVVAAWEQESIAGMAVLEDGCVLVALSHFRKGGTRLVRLGSRPDDRSSQEVFREDGRLGLLEADGVRVLLSVVGTSAPRTFFSRWQTTFFMSGDGGSTWRPWSDAAASTESLCLAPQGFWQVSQDQGPNYSRWR